MPMNRGQVLAVMFLFGTLVASQACGGGSGAKDGGGSGGAAGASATGGDSGTGTGGASATGGMVGTGGAMGTGGAAGGSSGITWHCAETAGSQCLCDSFIAYPQATCQTTFTCCYSAPLGARQACVCENREQRQCIELIAGTKDAVRQTTCPPP